ncbi:hypothetical protein ACFFRR_001533 [Megaselia abdita]
MNFLIFSSAFFTVVQFVGAQIGKECGPEEFTRCAEPFKMLHVSPEFSYAAVEKEELDKLCHELRKGKRCIESYTRRCMDLQHRNQFNKLYHGTNQYIRDLCNEGKFQEEYLKYSSCTQKAQQDSEACANKYKETMHFMKPNANQENPENITLNENIKTICCSINQLTDCYESAARKVCGDDAAKFTRQLVDKYSKNLQTSYCEDYSQSTCREGRDSAMEVKFSLITAILLAALTYYF